MHIMLYSFRSAVTWSHCDRVTINDSQYRWDIFVNNYISACYKSHD